MSFALAHQSKNNNSTDRKTSTSTNHSFSNHHRINKLNKDYSSDSVFRLQRAIGNQAVQRIMRSNPAEFDFVKMGILPKLRISQPGDIYEQEADRVAEQVMTKSMDNSVMPAMANKGDEERIDRKCSACEMGKKEEEENLNISRKPSTTMSSLEATDETANEISNVLSSSGSPLDSSTKQFMESRFGHDFSEVRIHTGEKATRSAASVNALAYTIGSDIVFGEGQFQPNTISARKLLAHELTHVIQQDLDRRATRRTEIEDGLNSVTGSWQKKQDNNTIFRFFPFGLLGSLVCDPVVPLIWDDYQEREGGGTVGAETRWSFESRDDRIYARFNHDSWVRPKFKYALDRSRNGCAPTIRQCKTYLGGHPGATWSLSASPSRTCPASIVPNPVTATSVQECDTTIGAECDRTAIEESARLLSHEQTHFDIACILARKGNDAISAGQPTRTILQAVRARSRAINDRYDRATTHGCNQAAQSSWEIDVSAGLPQVTIP